MTSVELKSSENDRCINGIGAEAGMKKVKSSRLTMEIKNDLKRILLKKTCWNSFSTNLVTPPSVIFENIS